MAIVLVLEESRESLYRTFFEEIQARRTGVSLDFYMDNQQV
ncbi:hypothetical protein P4S95_06705 [Aneurinibacillus aneurinilyticus]|nr:hypothetical protein [Aneurinibacillus aneurinilyticus]